MIVNSKLHSSLWVRRRMIKAVQLVVVWEKLIPTLPLHFLIDIFCTEKGY